MKAREVVLAVLIILAGIAVTGVKSGRLAWSWDAGDFIWGRGEEFIFEETHDIAAPLPAEIQVVNGRGTVSVEGAETDKITVHFAKRVYRRKKDDAQKIAAEVKLIVDRSEQRLVLSTNRESFRRAAFETDFKVTVPVGLITQVRNKYGLVRAGKTGRTEIFNRHGDVVVSSLLGPLVLENSYDDVEINGIQGSARIILHHADLTARKIQGETVIDHSYGKVRVEDLSDRLTINGRHSEVVARSLGADAEIHDSYDSVSVRKARGVKIIGHHCEIDVQQTVGLCDLANEYGTIRIGDLQGDLKIEARKTEVSGRLVRAEAIVASTTYEKLELLGFSGRASVSDSHAPIVLEPEAFTGPVEVRGSYSDVTLVWPAGARHPFEAETRQGAIRWGLSEPPSVQTSNGTSVTKAFLDETGRPPVRIVTSYGDVRVNAAGRPGR